MKKTSQKGIDLIKSSEGLSLKAYLCPAKKMTIGYGTTILPNGKEVPKGSICTKEEAEMFLKHDLEVFEIGVNKFVTVPINQNQFDALVCFSYNVGLGAFKKSSLLKKININPNDESINDSFLAYSKAKVNGVLVVLKGLETRRIKESTLYFS